MIMGKILGTIATIGILYGVSFLGDVLDVQDWTKKYVFPRGNNAEQSIVQTHFEHLENVINQYPEQASFFKDSIVGFGMHMPGVLCDKTKSDLIDNAVYIVQEQPLQYEDQVLSMVSSVMIVAGYDTKKKFYELNDDTTKDALLKEYLSEKAETYKKATSEALESLWDNVKEQYQKTKVSIEGVFAP
jgi:hypothetical protein